MRYVLYAFLAGAASAFAFEPVGFWPLMLIAIALLCEWVDRTQSLRRALLIGCPDPAWRDRLPPSQ